MHALDGHLPLIRPRSAELALRADQNSAGVGVDEQLRKRTLREPLRIIFGDFSYIFRLAFNRNFARPREHRAARLARPSVRFSLYFHFPIAKFSDDATGQNSFDE